MYIYIHIPETFQRMSSSTVSRSSQVPSMGPRSNGFAATRRLRLALPGVVVRRRGALGRKMVICRVSYGKIMGKSQNEGFLRENSWENPIKMDDLYWVRMGNDRKEYAL